MRGFGQYDPMWAMRCMAQGGIPIPETRSCRPKVYEPPAPYEAPVGDWAARMFCASQGKVWSDYAGGCIPTGVPEGPTRPPMPSCPGNETYDWTIGACVCPPGTEWTGTVGECSAQMAQKFVGEGTAPAGYDIRRFAAAACASMGGTWDDAAMECKTPDQNYQLPDFQPGALPAGGCPDDQVQTPRGCFPYPGGVENGQLKNGLAPPLPAKTETSSWVLPAVIGAGALAVIAIVATR